MTNEIFGYDFERFSDTLRDAIAKEQVIFRDGVAYWKKGLEYKGIIQHIPLKPIEMVSESNFLQSIDSIQSVISSAQTAIQSTVMITQAISTASLMVATVIQTQILSQKIEKVQECVLSVAHDIKEQNVVFYIDKASEYLGILQTFKILMHYNVNIDEVSILANQTLASALQIKNHLIVFIGNLIGLIDSDAPEIKNPNHVNLILQFIQQMMEILPFGMHCEFIISHRLNQKSFSQLLIEENNNQYSILLNQYRRYLNKIDKGINSLKIKPEAVPYFEQIKIPAKKLITSTMIREFLEKPALEHIAY